MDKAFPAVFGGIIAYILLLLYACTVLWMIKEVVYQTGPMSPTQVAQGSTGDQRKHDFPDGIVYVVTTIGGLVSALVVTKLTVTTPGDAPALVLPIEGASVSVSNLAIYLAIAYLGVWLIVGLAALIIGNMAYPDASQTLSNIGTTWLGTAVAAGYAYFGLSPKR